jgi:hypothetical protein
MAMLLAAHARTRLLTESGNVLTSEHAERIEDCRRHHRGYDRNRDVDQPLIVMLQRIL